MSSCELCASGLGAVSGFVTWWCVGYMQATDGPVQFRAYQGMDKWDYNMQNRDAKLIRESLGSKAAKAGWWDSEKRAI